jgi:predicted nucleic acid-binding protein
MLLDTSGLLCFHHRAEPQHAEAVQLFQSAAVRLTHSYVLAEYVALAQARGLPRQAVLSFVADLQDDPAVRIIWVSETLHRAAVTHLQQRLDKDWSLCDAVSFLLMAQHGIRDALTTDHHFEQAGFVRLLKP